MAAGRSNHPRVDPPVEFLSPRDAGKALGVGESSVKRWVDDGKLVADRTAGGHRRLAVAELIRFSRAAGVRIARPEVLGLPARGRRRSPAATLGDAADLLHDLLHSGDEPAARSLLLNLFLDTTPVAAIVDGPIAAAMARLGELWKHGEAGIALEHRAVDICVRALNQIQTLLPLPEARALRAVGGGPEGDPYVIPSLAAAAVLAEAGYRTSNLGPNTPFDALRAMAAEQSARLHRGGL